MKICYRMIDGRSYDIRFVDVDYIAKPDETIIDGDVLPTQEMLDNPTPAQLSAELDAKAIELQNAKLALAACLEILFDFVKNPALYTTANQLKLAAVERYKTKLQ